MDFSKKKSNIIDNPIPPRNSERYIVNSGPALALLSPIWL